jgi:alcohol dehydrogenase
MSRADQAFQAMVVRKSEDRRFTRAIETRRVSELPDGEVLIRVRASTINFKDRMSAHGNPSITRRFPHTPGVDAAGEIVESAVADMPAGRRVAVISHQMGMNQPGGFGQFVRVPAAWVMALPDTLSFEQAMAFGTPGYTAALAVDAVLETGLEPKDAAVAVTGAAGGVGAFAAAFLARLGARVTAVTGRPDAADMLRSIGVEHVRARDAFNDASGRNLLPPEFDAGVDVAGGETLSTLLRSLRDGGALAVTGNAADTAFPANVLPFILRGVRLIGVNAEHTDRARREAVWRRMAEDWRPDALDALYSVIPLAALPDALAPEARADPGRIVVDLG